MLKVRTWKKVNKKCLPFYFPGTAKHKGLQAAIAIDTSGSISQGQLKKALTEIWGLALAFKAIRFYIMICDADVWDVFELKNATKNKLLKLALRGGGGTDFRPVFKLIKQKYQNMVDCLVFFTDGYGDFPAEKPFYPVYWVTDSTDVTWPFGRVITWKSEHD